MAKGQRAMGCSKSQSPCLTCEDRGRVLSVEHEVAPAVTVPAPLTVAPVEVTDVQVAVRSAIDCSPEVDAPRSTLFVVFPTLGDEIGVSKQVVEHIRLEQRLAGQPLRKVIAENPVSAFLTLFEMKEDLGRVELEQAAYCTGELILWPDFPAFRDVWSLVTVDDESLLLDEPDEFGGVLFARAHPCGVFGRAASLGQCSEGG